MWFKFYGPRIGALYARNCLKARNEIETSRELKNTIQSPLVHPFFGAGQENGLRPGYLLCFANVKIKAI